MSLSRGVVNPLSVLRLRKLSFIPEHFSKIYVENFVDVKLVDHWINYNLNGRYAIRKGFIVNQTNKLVEVIEIGLEDPKEITMLTLGCSHLHNKERW